MTAVHSVVTKRCLQLLWSLTHWNTCLLLLIKIALPIPSPPIPLLVKHWMGIIHFLLANAPPLWQLVHAKFLWWGRERVQILQKMLQTGKIKFLKVYIKFKKMIDCKVSQVSKVTQASKVSRVGKVSRVSCRVGRVTEVSKLPHMSKVSQIIRIS